MDYAEIRRCLPNCRFTDHARREMETEPLGTIRVEEVLQALDTGEIIITTYQPDPERWEVDFSRRRR
jgi:hypothetical protein